MCREGALADMSTNARFTMLLHKNSPLLEHCIMDAHISSHHGGVELTKTRLRCKPQPIGSFRFLVLADSGLAEYGLAVSWFGRFRFSSLLYSRFWFGRVRIARYEPLSKLTSQGNHHCRRLVYRAIALLFQHSY